MSICLFIKVRFFNDYITVVDYIQGQFIDRTIIYDKIIGNASVSRFELINYSLTLP